MSCQKKDYDAKLKFICDSRYSSVLSENIQYQIGGIFMQLKNENSDNNFIVRNITTNVVSINMQRVLDCGLYYIIDNVYNIMKSYIDILNTPKI